MTERKFAHEMEAGDQFAPLDLVVTPEMNEQYLFAMQDYHPRYLGPEAIVHPGLLLNMSNNTKSPSFKLPPGWAEIHASEQTEFFRPAKVGERIRIQWNVIQDEEKRGRPWHSVAIYLYNEAGEPVMARVMTNTFTWKEGGDDKPGELDTTRQSGNRPR